MLGNMCQACPAGTQCQMQRCVPVAQVAVGAPCTFDPDCASLGVGAICKRVTSPGNATYQGGYCTLRCGQPGQSCPMGSSCASAPTVGENDNICLDNCQTAGDCRSPGYTCYSFGAAGFNACWIFPTPMVVVDAGVPSLDAGRPVGAACTNDVQCQAPATAFCIPPTLAGFNTGYLGGYCSRNCGAAVTCPAGSICVTETVNGQPFTTCKTICPNPGTGQSNCRTGYICHPNAAGSGWCGPRCNNQSLPCPNGGMCNNATGYCQ
ncbi:MAG: hypothetical protein JNK82_00555 [Myxococcaceae bacterium]|nr:hypothetical protein [Myxococcaceae bacterium]